MKNIQATDTTILPYPSDKIYSVLIDLNAYDGWWPKRFSFTVLDNGNAMVVKNGPFVQWKATIIETKPHEHIRFRYNGMWEGEASWSITQKADTTTVTYSINIHPNRSWLRVLSSIVDIGKLHSLQMKDVFRSLSVRLEQLPE